MAVVIDISYNGWLTIAIATKCSTNQSCEQIQFGGRVRYKPIIEAFFQHQLPPQKTKMTMEKQPFEDVSLECGWIMICSGGGLHNQIEFLLLQELGRYEVC